MSERASPLPRIVYLDGLRGIAALMIVLFHAWGGAGYPHHWVRPGGYRFDLFFPIEALGGTRVSLFFVLSGLLLFLPFVRSQARGERDGVTLADWLRRRFWRLLPPYYVGVAFSLVLALILGQPLDGFPIHLLCLQSMLPGQAPTAVNAAYWSMTTEVQLYLAFPLLAALALRWGAARMALLALALSQTYRWWLHREIGGVFPEMHPLDQSTYFHGLCNFFLGRWAEFALGMGAAAALTSGRFPGARWLYPPLLLALFAAVRIRQLYGFVHPLTDLSMGVAAFLAILTAARAPWLARAFSWRPLTALGTISFSVYLIHVPLLVAGNRFLAWAGVRDARLLFALSLAAWLPLILVAARAFWRRFERPFLSAMRARAAA